MKYILGVIAALLLLPASANAANQNVVRLATSSSLSASGLTDVMIPAFKQATGYELEVFAVGSGRALRMGRLGQADVVIAHAPKQEQKFVAAGHSELHEELMKNTFVLVGPPADPAGVKGSSGAAEAFIRIFSSESPFVSRADGSGNNKKELKVWRAANLKPQGQWYYETGESMLPALMSANELEAYVLVDSGSWLKNHQLTRLEVMVDDDPLLANPYSLIAASTARHPDINHEGKRRFVEWILSEEGKAVISSVKIDGQSLFEITHNR